MVANQPTTFVEQWKPVVGFEGRYEISDAGAVRSVARRVTRVRYPKGKRVVQVRDVVPAVMKTSLTANGYQRVTLRRKGVNKTMVVHRIVLEAFVGRRGAGQLCRHLNGCRTDNKLRNLCWGTPEENVADSKRHGTFRCGVGERQGSSRLTAKAVIDIRQEYRRDGHNKSNAGILARKYGVARDTVLKVVSRKTWAHIM